MYRNFLKPLFDFLLALILVLLFLPFYAITAALIYAKMGSPIFFRQKRPGKNGKIFTIYKFRTMSNECGSDGVLLPDEERLKGVGKFIRSTSLDELPQIFNVLRGDMSFIGPRPLLEEYLNIYTQEEKRRHNLKPGITGWAQVNGRNAISFKEKFQLDLWYVDNVSFSLDIKILFFTIKKVVLKEGVSANTHVTTEKYNGFN